MKKILHILKTALFAEDFVNFINNCFDVNDHSFIVYGEQFISYYNRNIIFNTNVVYYPRSSFFLQKKYFNEFLDLYDRIIIHGVFDIDLINFFNKNNYLLSKTVLYFWGGDKIPNNNWNTEQVSEYKFIIENAHMIVTVVSEDADSIKEMYSPKGKFLVATYGENFNLKNSDCFIKSKTINILVGNSATESNHHFRVLDILKKFQNENFLIHCPLSYGNKNYANEVDLYGKKLFGENFVSYKFLMKLDDYNNFLKTIDVGVFDIERQQAVGNINTLMSMGKKIYLRENSILDRFYTQECQCQVFHICDIENFSFEEFVDIDDEKVKKNIRNIVDFFDKEKTINEWTNVFEM